MILHTLAVAAVLHATAVRPPDPWFAEDKLKHFAASFVVSSLSASGARAFGLDRRQSVAAGAAVGLASGFAKEIGDARSGIGFSVKDILWDIAGVSAAVALLDASR